ncbi:MAG: thioredoxin domain-containing protein [Acidobacteriota bacterium]|nr:thioredoxin domain-containing protein [Acidobacteriota bacterium]
MRPYSPTLGPDNAPVTSAETERRIKQDAEDAQALGVTRTPTFFVNGKPLAQIGYEPVRAAIAAALR